MSAASTNVGDKRASDVIDLGSTEEDEPQEKPLKIAKPKPAAAAGSSSNGPMAVIVFAPGAGGRDRTARGGMHTRSWRHVTTSRSSAAVPALLGTRM